MIPYPSTTPSLPLYPPPSPNGKVARQLFAGYNLSPKATPYPCKRKATPNYETMDIE